MKDERFSTQDENGDRVPIRSEITRDDISRPNAAINISGPARRGGEFFVRTSLVTADGAAVAAPRTHFEVIRDKWRSLG